jgi:hypothetical protein
LINRQSHKICRQIDGYIDACVCVRVSVCLCVRVCQTVCVSVCVSVGRRTYGPGHPLVDRMNKAAVYGDVLLQPSVAALHLAQLAQVCLPPLAEIAAAAEAEGLDHDTLQSRTRRGRFRQRPGTVAMHMASEQELACGELPQTCAAAQTCAAVDTKAATPTWLMRKERWSTAVPRPTITPHIFPHCSTGRVRDPHVSHARAAACRDASSEEAPARIAVSTLTRTCPCSGVGIPTTPSTVRERRPS